MAELIKDLLVLVLVLVPVPRGRESLQAGRQSISQSSQVPRPRQRILIPAPAREDAAARHNTMILSCKIPPFAGSESD